MRPAVSSPSARSLAARSLAVGRGDPTTRRRLTTVVAGLVVLLTSACSSITAPQVKVPGGRQFIPMVPDSIDDVGLAPSVAVDGEGLPTVSYFGFPAKLVEGEIPVARPVGSPFLQTEDGKDAGAVLLASLTPDQIWTRGAIAQPRASPAGVPVPFDPAAEPSLATLTPARARGTDLAITGTEFQAAWTTDTGVWYGVGPSPFEVAVVEETREAGAPSIAVDGSGEPIVAYTVAGAQPEVRVAERSGERWRVASVATLSACGEGCPPATQVALVGEEPLVVVTDLRSGELIAAQRQGNTWATEVVATEVTGGASLAAAGDTAAISFYTPTGVGLATGRFGSWSIEEIAPVVGGGGEEASAAAAPTTPGTGVAVDGEGTTWVTWEDGEGIHLASGTEGQLEELELPDTTGGVTPTVATTEDGSSVYLAWYEPETGDLRLGTYAEIPGLLIAAPSPAPSPAPPSEEGCGEDGELILEVSAEAAVFDTSCLVGPANEPFTVTFDNRDATPNQPHNWSLYEDPEHQSAIVQEAPFQGPQTVEYPVAPLDPTTYYFQCDVHPQTMFGVLEAIEEAAGGAGGGGGGNGGGGGGGG
jgi:hypothetical protein